LPASSERVTLVIAGRAAPGAIVELLRKSERHDQAVAGPSGQFVMIPPRLPPGDYELTLRSRLPDGTLATSKQGVAIALGEVASNAGAVQSQAQVRLNVPETTVANQFWQDHLGRSSQARQLSQPPLHIAKRQDVGVSQLLHAAAAPLSDGGSSSATVGPKIATTVVSPGDSLWRISRAKYGVGTRYAVG
jgi:nucleoid-associated protein YgaU